MKFKFEFSFTIFGCSMNFDIKDKKLLSVLSDEYNSVNLLSFTSKCTYNTLTKGLVESNDISGYYFIENTLVYKLSEIIVQNIGIENLFIKNDIKIILKNRDEIFKNKQENTSNPFKSLNACKKFCTVNKEEFENCILNYKRIDNLSYKEEVYNSLYWLNLSYNVNRDNLDLNNYEEISKYQFLWTAFNSLYEALSNKKKEQEKLIEISQKPDVLEYFELPYKVKEITKEILFCKDRRESIEKMIKLKELADFKKLTLRNKKNVSDELKEAINENNNKDISKNAILCLYAIRNSNVHGSAKEERMLCNKAFNILNGLVKVIIKNII